MLATVFFPVAAALAAPAGVFATSGSPARGDAIVTWAAPTRMVRGQPFPVELRIEAPVDGAQIATWVLTPSAFTIGGKILSERKSDHVFPLEPGSVLTLELDLAPALLASSGFDGKAFELGFAKEYFDTEPISVRVFDVAPREIDFMTIPAEQLADFQVIMETSRGRMVFAFFPDKAPKHVRNFLDLCHTGFYDGILFHRVSPTFMIQGGCPNTKTSDTRLWGNGSGPRRLDAEFSDMKHRRGILSMARMGTDVNSATSQFFVMTSNHPSLDGQYSVFGELVAGDETLELISKAQGTASPIDGTIRPSEPQRILSATVIWSGETKETR